MKKRKNKELTYMDIKDMDMNQYMNEYGLGGWIKDNWANIATTAGGVGLAALGALATPFTGGASAALIAAGASMGAQGVMGFKGTADQNAMEAQQAEQTKMMEQQSKLDAANQRIQQTDNPTIQSPGVMAKYGGRLKKYAMGGEMMSPNVSETALFREYNGRSHDDGGINVGVNGNVVLPGERPIAEVEGKENVVMIDGEPYIMPDALKYDKNNSFADINKKDAKKYGLNNKDRGMIKSVDPITKKGYEKITKQRQEELEKLKQVIDLKNNRTQVLREQVGEFRTGGNLPKYEGGGYTNENGVWVSTSDPWEYQQTNSGWNTRCKGSSNWINATGNALTSIQNRVGKYTQPQVVTQTVASQNPDSNSYWHTPMMVVDDSPITNTIATPQNTWEGSKYQTNLQKDLTPKTQPTSTETPYTGKLFQGMGWGDAALSALPGLAGSLINVVRANRLKSPSKLNLSRISAENINLQRERDSAIEQANLTRSNVSRGLRSNVGSIGQYLSGIGSAQTGIGRGLGRQLGQSYQNEELQNAQFRQRAALANADIANREAIYNQQQQAQYDNAKRGMYGQALSQGLSGVTSALNQKIASNQYYDYMNMMNPNMTMNLPDNANWWQRNFQSFQTPVRVERSSNFDYAKYGQNTGRGN